LRTRFNKREEEYNDYLDFSETHSKQDCFHQSTSLPHFLRPAFNLVNNIDVEHTKAEIEKWRRANQDIIEKNLTKEELEKEKELKREAEVSIRLISLFIR
jgi:hypothetical protein